METSTRNRNLQRFTLPLQRHGIQCPRLKGRIVADKPDPMLARQMIVRAARDMLAGTLSFIEGAREIVRLRAYAKLPDLDPDLLPFIAIDSETDALPMGEVRKFWSAEALYKTQPEIERREAWAAEHGRGACLKLLNRFAADR